MNEHLLESLTALGQLAMQETGAAGYGLSRLDRETGSLVRLHSCGARICEFGMTPDLKSAVSYAARLHGVDPHVLTFVFRSASISEDSVKCLERMTALAEDVLGLSLWRERYAAFAEQMAELEAQLVHAKIRDRARGLIRSHATGRVETLSVFSETILRRTETATMLERLVAERHAEVEERSLTAQAKAVLESVYGMSEEQAHHHLRLTSRKNRRPLKEVALHYIGERS